MVGRRRRSANCVAPEEANVEARCGVQAACRAILALLSDPDADSPLNCDAGNMVRGGDMLAYNTTARMYTVENAMFLSWPKPKRRS